MLVIGWACKRQMLLLSMLVTVSAVTAALPAQMETTPCILWCASMSLIQSLPFGVPPVSTCSTSSQRKPKILI